MLHTMYIKISFRTNTQFAENKSALQDVINNTRLNFFSEENRKLTEKKIFFF